jgi:transglutaminase-like putative cysteine protease
MAMSDASPAVSLDPVESRAALPSASGGDAAVSATPSLPGARRLRVCHETRYDYDTPVEVAHHLAYLCPRETEWQRISNWQLDIAPEPDGGPNGVHAGVDAFGNPRHSFSHARVHDRLRVVAQFAADIAPLPPLQAMASPPWEHVAESLRYRAGKLIPDAAEFVLGSRFASRDRALAAFGADLFEPARPLLDSALALMHRVHDRIEFRAHATDVATSAIEVLARRRGVCQDLSHLMIAVMRSLGLSARYVSGYLLTMPPPGQARLIGADASHAWVSVWCPRQGWVALDPTNDCAVGQDHVTLAWGRDYADVAPLRGVIRGGGNAPPVVGVTVEPVEPVAPDLVDETADA